MILAAKAITCVVGIMILAARDYNVCSYGYGVCCGLVAMKLLRRNLHYGYPP